MKHYRVCLACVLIVLLLASCASLPKHVHVFERSLSEGGLYYLDTCVECGYREVYVDEGLAARCAPYFGLDSDISHIENPKTLEDYDNNILYAALVGDYTPTIHFDTKKELNAFIDEMFKENYFHSKRDGRWFSRYHALVGTYGALLGYATNQDQGYKVVSSKTGGYDLSVIISCFDLKHYPEGFPTEKDFFLQQLVALEQAKAIHDKLHGDGYAGIQINELTSDYEKMKIYNSFIRRGDSLVSSEYGLVKTDGIFAGLNQLNSNCAGTEALYTVFMHLENLKAQTYSVEGHVISRVEADGNIVFYDYFSRDRYFSSDEDYTKRTGTGGIEYGEGCWLLF